MKILLILTAFTLMGCIEGERDKCVRLCVEQNMIAKELPSRNNDWACNCEFADKINKEEKQEGKYEDKY